jgi:lipoprotein-anchoring transpeptidase ErfK/SrfK
MMRFFVKSFLKNIFFVLVIVSLLSFKIDKDESAMVSFLMEYLSIKYDGRKFNDFIYVAAKSQKMYHILDGKVVTEYTVSTAKNGIGEFNGSKKTPSGLHRIREKIGDKVPVGGIIKEKKYTGKIAEIIENPVSVETDDLTTRAMHLEGIEFNLNKGGDNDSYARAIFIHGTPEEGLLGTPASKGCVRMKNKDIVDLYDKTFIGMYVIILNN